MFEYFYNEILRRTIISFGTLFNGLTIKTTNADDDVVNITRVPLAYGPTQKFLARLEQQADLNKATAMTLPRMSFEFTGLTYDPARKVSTVQQFVVKDPDNESESKKAYMPVPYNMSFELAIMTKLNDDALQLVEQILPYFQPSYNLTVELVGSINEKRDIPIQLDGISMEDDYEGNFETRRALVYTLTFTAKTFLFGPLSDVSSDIIRKVTVGYVAGSRTGGVPDRSVTYSTVARATKDYTGDVRTLLAENVDLLETIIEVDDGTKVEAGKYIYVGQEEMLVDSVTGNKLTVKRAQDNTTVQNHVKGAQIFGINYTDALEDNKLIEFGDDFGFDGSIED